MLCPGNNLSHAGVSLLLARAACIRGERIETLLLHSIVQVWEAGLRPGRGLAHALPSDFL